MSSSCRRSRRKRPNRSIPTAGRHPAPTCGLFPRRSSCPLAAIGSYTVVGGVLMYFKQILDERCGCASYLIASRQSQEAAIIDPSLQIEPYEALLQDRGFRLRYVID